MRYLVIIHDVCDAPRAWATAPELQWARAEAERQWTRRIKERTVAGTLDVSEQRGKTTCFEEQRNPPRWVEVPTRQHLTEEQLLRHAKRMHDTHRGAANTYRTATSADQVHTLAVGLVCVAPLGLNCLATAEKLHSQLCRLARPKDQLDAIVAALREVSS
jgi:hypothetical protein